MKIKGKADLKMCIIMLGDKKRKTRSGKREQDRKNWNQENKKWVERIRIHCKKRLAIFPSPPAGMSLTKLSLARNNKNYSRPGRVVSDIPAGDGIIANLFLQCSWK